jgi:hypothetical protein
MMILAGRKRCSLSYLPTLLIFSLALLVRRLVDRSAPIGRRHSSPAGSGQEDADDKADDTSRRRARAISSRLERYRLLGRRAHLCISPDLGAAPSAKLVVVHPSSRGPRVCR